MKKAWLIDNIIKDVCHGNPDECYHPAVAILYTADVPDDAENGDLYIDGVLTKSPPPPSPPAPAVVPPTVSAIRFKMLFTSTERIAFYASNDPVLVDLRSIIDDPRTTTVDLSLTSVSEALDYMVTLGVLANADRKAQILTGEPI